MFTPNKIEYIYLVNFTKKYISYTSSTDMPSILSATALIGPSAASRHRFAMSEPE